MPPRVSDLAHMSKAEAFLPGSLQSDSKVAFYAGRPHGVPLNIAPPTLLCAPEFGIVHDAAHFGPSYSLAVGESEMDIARELCTRMVGSGCALLVGYPVAAADGKLSSPKCQKSVAWRPAPNPRSPSATLRKTSVRR